MTELRRFLIDVETIHGVYFGCKSMKGPDIRNIVNRIKVEKSEHGGMWFFQDSATRFCPNHMIGLITVNEEGAV